MSSSVSAIMKWSTLSCWALSPGSSLEREGGALPTFCMLKVNSVVVVSGCFQWSILATRDLSIDHVLYNKLILMNSQG